MSGSRPMSGGIVRRWDADTQCNQVRGRPAATRPRRTRRAAVQGHQRGHAGRRQVSVEVEAVEVDEVDRPAVERFGDGSPMLGLRLAPASSVKGPCRRVSGPGCRARPRSSRPTTIERWPAWSAPGRAATVLLGARRASRADGGQRVADVEDGQHRKLRSGRSRAASACARALPTFARHRGRRGLVEGGQGCGGVEEVVGGRHAEAFAVGRESLQHLGLGAWQAIGWRFRSCSAGLQRARISVVSGGQEECRRCAGSRRDRGSRRTRQGREQARPPRAAGGGRGGPRTRSRRDRDGRPRRGG